MRPLLKTRLAWFDLGAQAFAAACPKVVREDFPLNVGPLYVCPLCVTPNGFKAFRRAAVAAKQLTAEHVPPAHAGGRPLVLTCAECNHRAGTALDAHAHVARRLEPTADGVIERPVRVTFGNRAVNMTISADASGVRLFGDPARNAPENHKLFFEAVDEVSRAGSLDWRFGVEFHRDRFDPARAATSYLRAGYLAAFAKFGYRTILNAAFSIVRAKVADPSAPEPSLYGIRVPHAAESARGIVIIENPQELARGLAVQMGCHLVLLPGSGDLTFYERVARRTGEMVQLNGHVVPWPTRPEFLFDRTGERRTVGVRNNDATG